MTSEQTLEQAVYSVDPDRLAHGSWCHRAEKTLGQGDISESYSADRIANDQHIRKPFEWRGARWVCVSSSGHGGIQSAEAYRLVHPAAFKGEPTTYWEKLRDPDATRADPLGFYDGMAVKCAGERLVLCGPPVRFLAGERQQLDLFG